MIYLTTGANGSGKTLLTLKDVRALQLKENRPVCYNGRFDLVEGGELASWKKIDIKDWQAEPDGTIFLVDECHNDFPLRGTNQPPPEYVRMLGEHRKRGFDFFMITQHPQNIDVFVRRLVGTPGHHRHLKRTFGASLVSVLEWSAVNPQCERPNSGESGSVKMVPYPTEVYGWYRSAMLHTGKTRVPKAVYLLAGCLLLLPVAGWFTWKTLMKPRDAAKAVKVDQATVTPRLVAPGASSVPLGPTVAQYVDLHHERIKGLPYTAAVYDSITVPKDAPYPAACIDGVRPGTKEKTCVCYTQQATKLPTDLDLCRQIAANGFFLDWMMPRNTAGQAAVQPQAVAYAQPPAQGASGATGLYVGSGQPGTGIPRTPSLSTLMPAAPDRGRQ